MILFQRSRGCVREYLEAGHSRKVLIDANLHAARGEFVAILGKSGAGKTTVAQPDSGIDRVDCGDVNLGDQRLTGLNESSPDAFSPPAIVLSSSFFT